jgi:hypothetical protein
LATRSGIAAACDLVAWRREAQRWRQVASKMLAHLALALSATGKQHGGVIIWRKHRHGIMASSA